jgi:hypothetical protein
MENESKEKRREEKADIKTDLKTGGRHGRRDENGLFQNQGCAKTLATEPNSFLRLPSH